MAGDPFEMLPQSVSSMADAKFDGPHFVPPTELMDGLFDLLEEIRRDLRTRIEFNWETLDVKGKSERRLREWYVYHAVLAYDISGGIGTLLKAGNARASVPLQRCLLEYDVRIRYGAKRRGEIKAAFDQIVNRYRKAQKNDFASWLELQPKQVRDHRKVLLASGPAKVEIDRVLNMFEAVRGKRTGRALYDHFYGFWSMIVHGTEACAPDVFRNLFTEQEPRAQLDWTSRRWSLYDCLATTVTLMCELLGTIEDISGRGNASNVVFKKLMTLQIQHEPDYAEFTKKYEKQFMRRRKRRKK